MILMRDDAVKQSRWKAAAETWRRVWWDGKKFSRTKISEMTIFSGKNTQNF